MGRSPCCNVDGLKRGAWTAEEDQKLIAYIQEHGEGGWRTLPHKAGLQRCGKSCRLRWANYLRPDIKRGEFSPEEEERIVQLHASLGNRWSAIARHVPKRTDNEIKNYWNTHLKKRLSDKGIDPTTHKPISTASSSSSDAAVPSISTNHDTPSAPPGDRHVSSSSASAQLLNKLAAKLAPYSSSLHGDEVEAPNSKRSTSNSSSSSAKLLNKMASRLAHPLHCLNTLKSILSAAATSSLSESTAASRSISNSSNDLPAQTASCQQDDDQVAFLENVDLDVLNVWQHQHEQQQYGVVEQPSDAVVMDFLGDSSITTSSEKEGHQPYHYNYHQDSMFPASQYGRDDDLTLGGPHADLDDLFGTCGGMFRGEADHDEHHHHQYMDFDGPSTSASRNNDQRTLDHDNYDYAVDDDQQYAHRQFEYQHGAGGLLDGDDEHGRTFFNNYGDFHIDAPALF